MRMGTVFPVSTQNYELRYWLAASGINPGFYTANDTTGQTDADVLLYSCALPTQRVGVEQIEGASSGGFADRALSLTSKNRAAVVGLGEASLAVRRWSGVACGGA